MVAPHAYRGSFRRDRHGFEPGFSIGHRLARQSSKLVPLTDWCTGPASTRGTAEWLEAAAWAGSDALEIHSSTCIGEVAVRAGTRGEGTRVACARHRW